MHKTTTDVNIVAEVTKEALEDTDEPTNLEPDQLRIGIPQEPIASSYIPWNLSLWRFSEASQLLRTFYHKYSRIVKIG